MKQEEFVRRAKEKFGNKFDYSKVVYAGTNKKVCIICPEHGEFWTTPQVHLTSKTGCPECGKKEGALKNTLTTEEFIKRARKAHGDKYDYSKVKYDGSEDKVCIICPEHGEFWQTPSGHLRGRGCPECGKKASPRKTAENFIKQAKNVYGEKYTYSKVKYVNCSTNVIVTCPKHGDFSVKPNYFLNGGYCAKCKREEIFIKRAKEVHGNKYDYSKVNYVSGNVPVLITDKKCGEFWQKPCNHLTGHGYNVNIEKYSKENCYKIAQKYEYLYDFYENEKKCYLKAKKNGWIEEYTWLKKDSFWTNKRRLIYVYEFDNNVAYVGLTNCIERRDKQHRGINSNGAAFVPKYDSLYNYCTENNVTAPAPKILEEELTIEEAQRQEKYWIKKYSENGWTLLNKCGGGSIGALPAFTKSGLSIEDIVKECKQYRSGEDVKRHNKKLFNIISKHDLIKVCFPQNVHRKAYVYTENFIKEMVERYPLKNDLRKNECGVYQYLWEHGLLDKYYPKRLYPPQHNFLKNTGGDDQTK